MCGCVFGVEAAEEVAVGEGVSWVALLLVFFLLNLNWVMTCCWESNLQRAVELVDFRHCEFV